MLKITELSKLKPIHDKVVKHVVKDIRKNMHNIELVIFSNYGSCHRYVLYNYLESLWETEQGLYVTLYGLPAYDGYEFQRFDFDDMINATIDSYDWDDLAPNEIMSLIKDLENIYE